MAYTAPRTWVANEIVSAALMNTHVRDNLLETAPAKVSAIRQTVWASGANALVAVPAIILKAADETVNNSATLQNDDHMLLPLAANEVWAFEFNLFFTNASGTPGIKTQLAVPAGATGWLHSMYYIGPDAGTLTLDYGEVTATITDTPGNGIGSGSVFGAAYVRLRGAVVNSSTPGNLQLTWAQASATSSNTVLKANSYIIPTRLA